MLNCILCSNAFRFTAACAILDFFIYYAKFWFESIELNIFSSIYTVIHNQRVCNVFIYGIITINIPLRTFIYSMRLRHLMFGFPLTGLIPLMHIEFPFFVKCCSFCFLMKYNILVLVRECTLIICWKLSILVMEKFHVMSPSFPAFHIRSAIK